MRYFYLTLIAIALSVASCHKDEDLMDAELLEQQISSMSATVTDTLSMTATDTLSMTVTDTLSMTATKTVELTETVTSTTEITEVVTSTIEVSEVVTSTTATETVAEDLQSSNSSGGSSAPSNDSQSDSNEVSDAPASDTPSDDNNASQTPAEDNSEVDSETEITEDDTEHVDTPVETPADDAPAVEDQDQDEADDQQSEDEDAAEQNNQDSQEDEDAGCDTPGTSYEYVHNGETLSWTTGSGAKSALRNVVYDTDSNYPLTITIAKVVDCVVTSIDLTLTLEKEYDYYSEGADDVVYNDQTYKNDDYDTNEDGDKFDLVKVHDYATIITFDGITFSDGGLWPNTVETIVNDHLKPVVVCTPNEVSASIIWTALLGNAKQAGTFSFDIGCDQSVSYTITEQTFDMSCDSDKGYGYWKVYWLTYDNEDVPEPVDAIYVSVADPVDTYKFETESVSNEQVGDPTFLPDTSETTTADWWVEKVTKTTYSNYTVTLQSYDLKYYTDLEINGCEDSPAPLKPESEKTNVVQETNTYSDAILTEQVDNPDYIACDYTWQEIVDLIGQSYGPDDAAQSGYTFTPCTGVTVVFEIKKERNAEDNGYDIIIVFTWKGQDVYDSIGELLD